MTQNIVFNCLNDPFLFQGRKPRCIHARKTPQTRGASFNTTGRTFGMTSQPEEYRSNPPQHRLESRWEASSKVAEPRLPLRKCYSEESKRCLVLQPPTKVSVQQKPSLSSNRTKSHQGLSRRPRSVTCFLLPDETNDEVDD